MTEKWRGPGSTGAFDVFISYARSASQPEAEALHPAIERCAKPWYRKRSCRVFRDDSSMSAESSLQGAIESALQSARFFILITSRAAAASDWVNKEVEWWLSHKDPMRILVAQDDGDLAWTGNDFSADSHIPPALRGRLKDEPRWVDLTWFDDPDSAGPDDPRFVQAVQELAAPILGIPRDEIGSVAVVRHRRTMRIVRVAIATLSILLVAALVASALAWVMFGRAQEELRRSTASNLAAQAVVMSSDNPRMAALSALAAHSLLPSDASDAALFAVAEANESVAIAKTVYPAAVDQVTDLGGYLDNQDWRNYIATHSLGPSVTIRDAARLTETSQIRFPGQVTRIEGYSVTARGFLIVQADGLWYASEISSAGKAGPAKQLESQASADDPIVWAGRVPTRFEATFVVVRASGAVHGWDSELHTLEFPAFRGEGGIGSEPLQAVGRDARWGESRLVGAVRAGAGSTLLSYQFGADGKSASTIPIGDVGFPAVTALAETPQGIVVGTDNGAALLCPDLAARNYPLGGVTGRIRQIQLPHGYGGFAGFLLLTEGGTFSIRASSPESPATAGPVAVSAAAGPGFILGHADGRVSIMGEEGDLRKLGSAAAPGAVFDSDGLLIKPGSSSSTTHAIDPMEEAELLRSQGATAPAKRAYRSPVGALRVDHMSVASRLVVLAGQIEGQAVGSVLAFDRVTEQFLGGFQAPRSGLYMSLAISPDGSRIAAHHESGQLDVVDFVNQRKILTTPIGVRARVGGFSADGQQVLTFSEDYRARPGEPAVAGLLSVPVSDSGEPVVTPMAGAATTFALSPDREAYAIASGREVRVMEAATHRTVAESVLERNVSGISWSTSGSKLTVVLTDWGVAAVDAANLKRQQPVFRGSTSDASALPSLWEPEPDAVPGAVPLLAFDGKVFKVGTPDWRSRMCAIAGDSLTQSEWADSVNQVEPYQELCPSALALSANQDRPQPTATPSVEAPAPSDSCGPPLAEVRALMEHPEVVVDRMKCSTVDPDWASAQVRASYSGNSDDTRVGLAFFHRVNGVWTKPMDGNGFHGGSMCSVLEEPSFPADLRSDLPC